MSSSYIHYASPSSLPSDYGLLAQFASQKPSADDQANANDNVNDDADALPETNDNTTTQTRHPVKTPRPNNIQSDYVIPFNPTMGPLPDEFGHHSGPHIPNASETTPLLAPPIPRIVEECDDPTEPHSSSEIYREELGILTKYTLPVFGTHIFEYSLVIASVVSIGHLSTTALAAATLGSMTASVSGYSIMQGFGSTLDTMLPSAWTSSEPRLVGLWSQRMAVVMGACLMPILVIWFNAESILLVLRQEPEVAHLAGIYLKWAAIGLPAYGFNCIIRRYYQSQGLFNVPTRIISAVAPINVLLNYLLVWGPAPFRLGFIGAPIATGISFNLISIISVLYGVFFAPKTAWHPLTSRCFTNLGILVQLGLGGVGQTASEWWSWELVGLAASLLGPVSLATQSVLLVSASTTFQAAFALSIATSVRIGNLLGEENAVRAVVSANVSIFMVLIISAVWSSMFLIFKNSWAYLFNSDPEVVALTASILPLVALFQVFDGTAAVTGGILRARGKQFTGALLNLTAYYMIGIPFGIWLAFKRDMNLHGLWIGLTVSLVYCAAIGVWLCVRTDWDHEVEKVRQRLAADKKPVDVEGHN